MCTACYCALSHTTSYVLPWRAGRQEWRESRKVIIKELHDFCQGKVREVKAESLLTETGRGERWEILSTCDSKRKRSSDNRQREVSHWEGISYVLETRNMKRKQREKTMTETEKNRKICLKTISREETQKKSLQSRERGYQLEYKK